MMVIPATPQPKNSAVKEITMNVRCEMCRTKFTTRVENEIFCPKCSRKYHYVPPYVWYDDRKLTIYHETSEIREFLHKVSVADFFFANKNYENWNRSIERFLG